MPAVEVLFTAQHRCLILLGPCPRQDHPQFKSLSTVGNLGMFRGVSTQLKLTKLERYVEIAGEKHLKKAVPAL